MTYDKVCVICGKEFLTNRKTTVCCSDKCKVLRNGERALANYHSKHPVMRVRTCKACGKQYQPDRRNQSTCSTECAEEYNRIRNNKKYKPVKKRKKRSDAKPTCPICGTVFKKTSPNQVYCTPLCQQINHRHKMAIRYHKIKYKKTVDNMK